MNIGENIKRIRKLRGLTQKELGEKLGGISQQQVGQWENNDKNPRIETIEKIANALHVNVSVLLGYSDLKEIMTEENRTYLCNKRDNEIFNDFFKFKFMEMLDMTEDKTELLYNYNKLNENGKKEAQKRIEELTELLRYIEKEENTE